MTHQQEANGAPSPALKRHLGHKQIHLSRLIKGAQSVHTCAVCIHVHDSSVCMSPVCYKETDGFPGKVVKQRSEVINDDKAPQCNESRPRGEGVL